ncbi:component of oligomeric golgi complex 8 (predicted), isoform CRA_c [Rattus norvegicus]|uniref:Conserved oligomeric Golgi complex subunit 8 n=1 Tax=Rattus norvegicus TaxID=10116 RepID=A6IYY6_RAT|nr:component of oligomeric golgi complex 8 (predicted), isoform CRA_c [Rattus norvegicus]
MAAALSLQPSTTASATTTATAAALGEVEDEGLLASLFRDRFPEAQWREKPDVGRYLRELSGSGLDRLRREPERLAEERAQLLQQTRDLAFANYKTFIRGAECTERIHRLFGDVEASLGHLLDRLPSFQQSCRNFVKEAEEISSNRRMNTLTLNRHTEILEILEIPQLMDTCVRNSYYEEALELAAYVRRLERKYSSIPVIQGIVNEVRQSMQLMLSQLIQQLRTSIQLPACLRVIGYLRRMDVFTEAELRVKFLQARDAWLRSILTAIPNDDPYFHITKNLVPYLNRCLQVLFPPAQIAQTLGISPTQLSKHGNLGHVNISAIQEPLAFILPKREAVFCLDDQELVPDLVAPAPELPAEQRSLEPIASATLESGSEKGESGEPLPQEPVEGEPLPAEPPSEEP